LTILNKCGLGFILSFHFVFARFADPQTLRHGRQWRNKASRVPKRITSVTKNQKPAVLASLARISLCRLNGANVVILLDNRYSVLLQLQLQLKRNQFIAINNMPLHLARNNYKTNKNCNERSS